MTLLDEVVRHKGFVLHDRRVPGRRLNLDHLVVMPSGVWVIDTKHYHGRLARRRAAAGSMPGKCSRWDDANESRLISSATNSGPSSSTHWARTSQCGPRCVSPASSCRCSPDRSSWTAC